MYADDDGYEIGGDHNGSMARAVVVWLWGGTEGGASSTRAIGSGPEEADCMH